MFRSIAIAAAAAVAMAASGTATGQEDIGAAVRGAACSSIADSLQRLTCFDAAFPKSDTLAAPASSLSPADVEPTGIGLWQVELEKSAIDDSPKVTAYLAPKEAQSVGIFKKALIVRCVENTTSVIVSTDDFQFGADTGSITYRIDSAPAVSTRWAMSDNNSAMGLWNGGTAIPFLRTLREAKTLAVRTEMQKRVDMTFDVTGIAAVVDEVAAACKWPTEK